MINEKKLREQLAKILERPAYRGLYTYAREPLIDAVVKTVKECEEPEAVAEEEAVEEAVTVEEPEPEPKPEPKQKKKRRW